MNDFEDEFAMQTNGVNGYNNHSANNFYQLLNISHFLLVFVRTLEEQKSFSIKDKLVFCLYAYAIICRNLLISLSFQVTSKL
jgi:Plexin cytoplasmic RasGAP domain